MYKVRIVFAAFLSCFIILSPLLCSGDAKAPLLADSAAAASAGYAAAGAAGAGKGSSLAEFDTYTEEGITHYFSERGLSDEKKREIYAKYLFAKGDFFLTLPGTSSGSAGRAAAKSESSKGAVDSLSSLVQRIDSARPLDLFGKARLGRGLSTRAIREIADSGLVEAKLLHAYMVSQGVMKYRASEECTYAPCFSKFPLCLIPCNEGGCGISGDEQEQINYAVASIKMISDFYMARGDLRTDHKVLLRRILAKTEAEIEWRYDLLPKYRCVFVCCTMTPPCACLCGGSWGGLLALGHQAREFYHSE